MSRSKRMVDQILVLTHAAMQALEQDDLTELESNLADRGRLLNSLPPGALEKIPAADAARILAADACLRRALDSERSALICEGQEARSNRRARTAYARTA